MNLENIQNTISEIDINNIFNILWEGITFESYVIFIIIYFITFWLFTFVWIFVDITKRSNSFFYQILCVIIGLFPILGLLIYLIIRPSKTLVEKRRIEINENLDNFSFLVDERRKRKDSVSNCFKCTKPVSPEYNFCPNCEIRLKDKCKKCSKMIFTGWKICAFCGFNNHKKNEFHVKSIEKKSKKNK